MLFSEIYSAYYNTVAKIICAAQKSQLDSDLLYEIVKKSAFQESVTTIGTALESGKWPLVKKDYSTNIKNVPTMPLSLLQKQWLKAILNDKRIKLFVNPEILHQLENQLKDVEPLFTENDFYLYDNYSDGDSYDDEKYVKNFKTVLEGIHQNKILEVVYEGRFAQRKRFLCVPQKIEYSQKDDKFRVLSNVKNHFSFLNMARIKECKISENQNVEKISELDIPSNTRASVTLEIYDDRKAMERIMLGFAHFEKSAVQINDYVYQLTLHYDSFDETELVVRVLSYGPMVKVLEPESFKNQIKQRISKQMELMKNGN
jgi:hypothetical protein